MQWVIVNLPSNAVKFTEPGGGTSISAWIDGLDGEPVIRLRDTGIGTVVEDIPRVMEPFTQIASSRTRQRERTGLGLPLAKNPTEVHGSSADMEAAPGKGTTVRTRLPAERVVTGMEERNLFGAGE